MLKKGIIQEDMQGRELNEFLRSEIQSSSEGKTTQKTTKKVSASANEKGKNCSMTVNKITCELDNSDRASEVTVYRKAVPQVIPDVNQQINQFIQDVRNNIESSARNISTSSDEIMMDTSNESNLQMDSNNLNVISGNS